MREEINYISDHIKLAINSIYGQTGYTDYKEFAKNIYDLNEERLSLKKALERDEKIDLILNGMD